MIEETFQKVIDEAKEVGKDTLADNHSEIIEEQTTENWDFIPF